MSTILLSVENWRAAKAALHSELPEVRSSHLAEAMAAMVGARTHAAVAGTLRGEHDWPPITYADAARFIERLERLGYAGIAPERFADALAPERLPHAPYAYFKSGDRPANDRHYLACRRLGRPMMMVTRARRYAELEWDCITVDPREEEYLHDEAGESLVRIMFNLFQARAKGAPGKPLFCGSAFTGTVKKLLPETARQLAEDYFRLLYEPLLTPRVLRRRAS